MVEFVSFGKIARLTREVVVTEKIDGTNAAVQVHEVTPDLEAKGGGLFVKGNSLYVVAQSRTRFIQPGNDNHGFAAWVHQHAEELADLGPGVHFGEWWGAGIQRGYGLPKGEKRFSLFNVSRWNAENVPACCHVVPTLYQGVMDEAQINGALTKLFAEGSVAAPGFMKPEGIIVYHTASGTYYKKTALGVDGHKEAA